MAATKRASNWLPKKDYRAKYGNVGAKSRRILADADLRKVVEANSTKRDIMRSVVRLTRGKDGTADVLAALQMKYPHFKGDGDHSGNLDFFFKFRDQYRREHGLKTEREKRNHTRAKTALKVNTQTATSKRTVGAEIEEEELMRALPKGQGYGLKTEDRRVVERHAMKVAQTQYKRQGYRVADTHANRPYDYLCEKDGKIVYVEVKGTTSSLASVFLTRGEVEHAKKNRGRCTLFVVYNISLDRSGDKPKALGGKKYLIEPWRPDTNALTPLLYRYELEKR